MAPTKKLLYMLVKVNMLNILFITDAGDIDSSLWEMLVIPGHASNLLYVGKLVGNIRNVSFSRTSCLVQKNVSGRVTVKRPKVETLSPLQFITSNLSLACNNVLNYYENRHRKFGHQNSNILSHLFKMDMLVNKKLLVIPLFHVLFVNRLKLKYFLFRWVLFVIPRVFR